MPYTLVYHLEKEQRVKWKVVVVTERGHKKGIWDAGSLLFYVLSGGYIYVFIL